MVEVNEFDATFTIELELELGYTDNFNIDEVDNDGFGRTKWSSRFANAIGASAVLLEFGRRTCSVCNKLKLGEAQVDVDVHIDVDVDVDIDGVIDETEFEIE
jgi:hypothetical protein